MAQHPMGSRNERRVNLSKETRATLEDAETFKGDAMRLLEWHRLVREEAIAAGDIDTSYAFTDKDLAIMDATRIAAVMTEAFNSMTAAQREELAQLTFRQARKFMNGAAMPEYINGLVQKLVARELAEREEEFRTRIVGEINDQWEAMVADVVRDRVEKAVAKIKSEIVR